MCNLLKSDLWGQHFEIILVPDQISIPSLSPLQMFTAFGWFLSHLTSFEIWTPFLYNIIWECWREEYFIISGYMFIYRWLFCDSMHVFDFIRAFFGLSVTNFKRTSHIAQILFFEIACHCAYIIMYIDFYGFYPNTC